MDVEKLRQELERLKIPENTYSILTGGFPSETLCLVYEDKWKIYYSEHGQRTYEKKYESEADACSDFLKMLTRTLNN